MKRVLDIFAVIVAGASLVLSTRVDAKSVWLTTPVLDIGPFARRWQQSLETVPLALIWAALCWGCWRIVKRVQRRNRWNELMMSRRCGNCGYSLIGNLSGVCPECGSAIAGA